MLNGGTSRKMQTEAERLSLKAALAYGFTLGYERFPARHQMRYFIAGIKGKQICVCTGAERTLYACKPHDTRWIFGEKAQRGFQGDAIKRQHTPQFLKQGYRGGIR